MLKGGVGGSFQGFEMKIRMEFELNDEQAGWYLNQAIKCGYQRVDPTKRWSEIERKEAIRFIIRGVINDFDQIVE